MQSVRHNAIRVCAPQTAAVENIDACKRRDRCKAVLESDHPPVESRANNSALKMS